MTTDPRFQSQLHTLPLEDCWNLLSTACVGRIAYVGPDGLEVIPLNYVVLDGTVLFRTSPYAALGRHLPGVVAAFEADQIDETTRSGWSVLLRGTVELVEPNDLPAVPLRPVAWPAGGRMLHLRLTPHSVTGRRLLASW
jgi:nitroimidazol reductase NimA-like FMN-containing flavoprotein (pyridoxamine 5'-phosphate oxidase superfamily)